MPRIMGNSALEVFSTCPASSAADRVYYLQRVVEVARWSEQNGCKGILVYADNSQVDPWLVAQVIVANTSHLCPLVAVQPAYSHPYAVAKMLTSFAFLYGRRLYLNMVAGGFKNDLTALGDPTPHDKRYARLVEYTTIIKLLLEATGPVTYEGEFYRVDKLRLTPPLPPAFFPGIFLSGSSEAGLAAARALGATAIKYPEPATEGETPGAVDGLQAGIRVGIIARDQEEKAWEIAHQRFPEDRKGQLTHQLAMKTSDSVWHHQLSELARKTDTGNGPYWLVPFNNYKTFCPYLVGSYQHVAQELARYMGLGYNSFILDIPPNEEELQHTNVVFEQAAQLVGP